MRVYCTSKNRGPSWAEDPITMLYLGTSMHEAEQAVGDFKKYKKSKDKFPINYPNSYSAIPATMEREMIQYFMADGWWFSIVMFDLE